MRWRRKRQACSPADYFLGVLSRTPEDRVNDALRLQRANGYLAGFRDATDGVPFDPAVAAAINDVNASCGLPRDVWLSWIGYDD